MKERLLYPETEMNHSVDIQTRFSDYDTFGHVNNNSYMAYFDLGKSHYFHRLMGCDCTPVALSAAIVNINVDFLSPAVAGERLRVRTAVVALGERSFTLYQRIDNPETGHVKAQATSVLAGFDIATQGAAPLRPEVAARLREALGK